MILDFCSVYNSLTNTVINSLIDSKQIAVVDEGTEASSLEGDIELKEGSKKAPMSDSSTAPSSRDTSVVVSGYAVVERANEVTVA